MIAFILRRQEDGCWLANTTADSDSFGFEPFARKTLKAVKDVINEGEDLGSVEYEIIARNWLNKPSVIYAHVKDDNE